MMKLKPVPKAVFFCFSLLIIVALGYTGCKKEEELLDPAEIKSDCRTGLNLVHKVLFVGVDGCRTDAMLAAHSSTFDSLMAHGYVNLHCDRGPYTVSCPGWSTLLHGVYPAKHGVTSNDLSNLDYGNYHDLFYYLRQSNPAFSLATVSHWDNFLRLTSNEDYAMNVPTDEEVKNKAIGLLLSCVPDVLLLHFDDVDHTGHASGFSPDNPEYIQAIVQTGNYVGEIMQLIKLREQTTAEEWMVVVVTDHGGSGKGHGDQDNVEVTRFVFEIVRLPGLLRTDLPVATNADIMPTILKYIEVPIDSAWSLDGSPLF